MAKKFSFQTLKVLGVTLDSKVNFNVHVQSRVQSAIATIWMCRGTSGKNQGLSPKVHSWIYTAIVRSKLADAALFWQPRCQVASFRKQLVKVQSSHMYHRHDENHIATQKFGKIKWLIALPRKEQPTCRFTSPLPGLNAPASITRSAITKCGDIQSAEHFLCKCLHTSQLEPKHQVRAYYHTTTYGETTLIKPIIFSKSIMGMYNLCPPV